MPTNPDHDRHPRVTPPPDLADAITEMAVRLNDEDTVYFATTKNVASLTTGDLAGNAQGLREDAAHHRQVADAALDMGELEVWASARMTADTLDEMADELAAHAD